MAQNIETTGLFDEPISEAILAGLNAEQLAAVTTTEGPVLIIAGAGTGKTTVVTRRIGYLIEKELAVPSQILALTFTDKAALEMEERVDMLVPMGYVDAWILTFHAFGDRILREHALEMGLSPDFKVMGKTEQILFLQQHLFELGLDYYRPLSNPTKFLEALVGFISRCKDEDITPLDYQRYVDDLVENSTPNTQNPKETQYLKAKSEDVTESDERVSGDVIPAKAGIEANLNRSDSGLRGNGSRSLSEDAIALLQHDDMVESTARQAELARAYAKYEELKREANLMDFGDQVVKVVQLFRSRPDILAANQQKFKYILVDEFQDTNYSQNQLVQLLAATHQNICVVGDDDQSIYKFRGAAISNILQFEQDFPQTKRVVLTQNYRSTQKILDASYRLIQHNNPDRLEVAHAINKRLVAPEKTGGVEPEELFGQTLSEEAELVVTKIEELMTEQPSLQFKDFALLVRGNMQAEPFIQALTHKGMPIRFSGASGLYERPEIRLIISFLTAVGNVSESMNVFHLAASEFYTVPMHDLVAMMDWASSQHKSLHSALAKLDELSDQLDISAEGQRSLTSLSQDISTYLDRSRTEEVGKLLYAYLSEKGYLERLETRVSESGSDSVEASTTLSNIAKFFDQIRQFNQLSERKSVREFLNYLTMMREAGDDPVTAELDPDLNAIHILTVHAAKGLEFAVVFMVNLVTERFPSRQRSELIPLPDELIRERLPAGDFHLQEERRLFYVAMTRAKDRLFMGWGRDYGGKRERKISPFVLEALDRPSQVASATKLTAIERIHRHGGQLRLPMAPEKEQSLIGVSLNPHKVDDYETCPLKYYYGNELRVPTDPHHALVYGTSIHRAIEEFYRYKQQGKTLDLDSLLNCFGQVWESKGFLSADHEQLRFDQGQTLLREFWQREQANPFAPSVLEKDFQVKVGEVVVRGRWDRLDVAEDGSVTILDYKTTSGMDQKKADKKAKESVQLLVYTLAYSQMYNGQLPNRVGLLFVDGNIFGSYVPTQQHLEDATQRVLAVASGVQQRDFEPTPSAMACEHCPFNQICPAAVK